MCHRTKRMTPVSLTICMLMIAGLCRIALGAPETAPALLQQQAIQRIEHFIEHFRQTGDQVTLLGELQQAHSELTTSYEAFKRTNDLASAALSLIKRGDIKRMQDQWQQALEDYEEAARLAQSADHLTYQAQALVGQAKAAFDGRDYGAAAAAIEQAVQLSARSGDQRTHFNALMQMSHIQSSRGDLNAAADSITLALDVALDDQSRLYGHLYRGNVYLERARVCYYDNAFDPCYKALKYAEADYIQTLVFATQLGDTAQAHKIEELLQGAKEVRKVLDMRFDSYKKVLQMPIFHPKTPADVLVIEQFLFSHPPDPALSRHIEQSKGFADADNALNFYLQGLAHKMQGDYDAALAAHLKAVELLETDRRQLRDERSRGTFLEDKMRFYSDAIRHLLDRQRFAEAFAWLEHSRSRAMADLLASPALEFSRPEERALYAELQQSKAEIARGQQELFELRSAANHSQKTEKITRKERDLQIREGVYQLLLSQIATDAPKLLELGVSKPVSLQILQQSMQEEQYEVLSYLVLEDVTILWHISSNTVHVRTVFLPRTQLIDKVERLRRSLDKDNSFDEQTAQELFLFLIQPALQWITSNHLVILPHEALYGIPFQVFQDPSNHRYLGERFQLSYAPSATILLRLKQMGTLAGGRLLAIAKGINNGPEEVEAAARFYPNAQKVIKDGLVTKTDLKAWAGDYDLLHLSVHGRFKAEAPLLSYLELSKGGQDDGRLTAAEMFGLPLTKTRLVVLSACETGRTEATHANEILGMVRALLYAGANALILSSWEVDAASTALWMKTFYQEAQTKPVREAARLALVAVKNDPQYTHPFYWAPFVVIGK